jgi:signal transduction histidine kinase/ActR/RegA family two-component response regulator
MSTPGDEFTSLRVAILTPTGKDAALTAGFLSEAAIESVICTDISCIEAVVEGGVGVLLIAEEAIAFGGLGTLAAVLSRQPAWSDIPVLLLTHYPGDLTTVAESVLAFGNVTLLERPVRPATLLSNLRSALKARERQYQVGAFVAEQERINARLETSIRERERVEAALREADSRKDEFLATLAHELRNPLAPIRNSLHILRLCSGGEPAADQVCEVIERQVAHLVRLVDDLLEVSRITRGKVELRLEPVELAAVIRSAVEASRPVINASGHQLAISLPTEPVVLMGDSVRLTQSFINLLNNAAKYTNNGGQIWLNARTQNDRVVVSVRDTGVGIAPEMLPRIFDMFTQLDRSKRQAQGGLGIGLTLVKSLVEMHGGEVEATSPGENHGSEFVVRLPLSKRQTVASPAKTDSQNSNLPDRRVLVVDDNRDAAISLGRLLKLLGADVHVVHDGPAALQVLSTFRPTVVLLDIGMPGMDGYEVARRIRKHPDWGDVVLIAVTGWGQEQDRLLATQAGFDHHLLKPADAASLGDLLTSIELTHTNR